MTNTNESNWQSKLPKNNMINTRFDDAITEKIAKLAWDNGITTTKQTKILVETGLSITERNDDLPVFIEKSPKAVSIVPMMTADEEQKMQQAAEKHGRTVDDQLMSALSIGLQLQEAFDAVSDFLACTPPPFSGDGWKPNQGECVTFIKQCIAAEMRQLGADI